MTEYLGIDRRNSEPRINRRFHLERDEDVSGVSGTGITAYGIQFFDGTVVMRWDTLVCSTGLYDSIEDLERISGHGGATRIVFDD